MPYLFYFNMNIVQEYTEKYIQEKKKEKTLSSTQMFNDQT